ncbi:MAG: peptidase S8 [Synechococcaceae cyanobacterium SM2_3_60]|nr:peptidase S8 [Synechococcaceae cyanobacterium SM2_3_60]
MVGIFAACLGVSLTLFLVWPRFPAPFESILVNFSPEATAAEIQTIARQYHLNLQRNPSSAVAHTGNVYEFEYNPDISGKPGTLLRQLTREPIVKFAEPNYQFTTTDTATFVPNDEFYPRQWNFEAIAMPQAWRLSQGEGAVVAVIDTGVTPVSDLAQTTFVSGYDFVDGDDDPSDLNGHGTHVAGTIAQSTNNGLGVAGIAYKAAIMPIRVLDANGFGTVADIAAGIRYAADHGATVINLSLGGRGGSELMQDAVRYAYRKGVTIVAAAGNDGSDQVSYPARYAEVIGVAAVGPTGDKAPYSNYGGGVDISAPGGAKTSEHPEWGVLQQTLSRRNPQTAVFDYFQGTSMAAPHVAGVAALVQSLGVTQPDAVRDVLKRSAVVVPDDKLNFFGAGRLNAAQALQGMQESPTTNPLLLWLQDFLRYLNDNGYLNPRFWFDGGAVMLLPKALLVLGGYIVTILVRWWVAPKRFVGGWPLWLGLLWGSGGLFVVRGVHIMGLPHWPMQIIGSAWPELGTALSPSLSLNPLFASALLPLLLITFCLGIRSWRWAIVGISAGIAAHLLLSGTVLFAGVQWLPWEGVARTWLIANGLVCLLLTGLVARSHTEAAY